MANGDQARLRLAVLNGETVETHLLRNSESSRKAASPLGEAVRPCSMSLTDDGERPTRRPIPASVSPLFLKPDMREAQVTVIQSSLRHPVIQAQLHPVTEFRQAILMAYKLGSKEIPRFKTLGARIAWWRTERKIDRRELAKRAGVPYSTLAEIENERQHASTKIASLAAALQINAYYLETDEGDPLNIVAIPVSGEAMDWPFSFPRKLLNDFDANELELAEMKYVQSLEQIKKRRRKQRSA